MNAMINKASQLSVQELKAQIFFYFNKFDDVSMIVCNALVGALMAKTTEADFCKFCDAL